MEHFNKESVMAAVVIRNDDALDLSQFGLEEIYSLCTDAWKGCGIVIFPQVPGEKFFPTKLHFARCASGGNLDLKVRFYDASTITNGEVGKPSSRWDLGFRDGASVRIYIFSKEFFGHEDAEKALYQVITFLSEVS